MKKTRRQIIKAAALGTAVLPLSHLVASRFSYAQEKVDENVLITFRCTAFGLSAASDRTVFDLIPVFSPFFPLCQRTLADNAGFHLQAELTMHDLVRKYVQLKR